MSPVARRGQRELKIAVQRDAAALQQVRPVWLERRRAAGAASRASLSRSDHKRSAIGWARKPSRASAGDDHGASVEPIWIVNVSLRCSEKWKLMVMVKIPQSISSEAETSTQAMTLKGDRRCSSRR